MKYRRMIGLLVTVLTCLAISACSPKYARHDGTMLTRPSDGVTTIKINNIGGHHFYAGKDGERQLEVLPGRHINLHFKSEEEIGVNFTWFDDLGRRGQEKDRFQVRQTGLHGTDIDVDEAYLTNLIGVPIIITNDTREDIEFKDTCMIGVPIIIPAQGYYWSTAIPGQKYECSWWPAKNVDPRQHSPLYYCDNVPARADKIFMGKRYARGIHIKRARQEFW